jgi:hypothetical protein
VAKGDFAGDELSLVAALMGAFESVAPSTVITSSAVWDITRWDQGSWSDATGTFQRMLARLRQLDIATGKKHRDPHNTVRDVLIAQTAINNDAVLVSTDENLRSVVAEFGGRAIPVEALVVGNDMD